MALSDDDILQILKIVDESTFDVLHLETGDLKLVLRKRGEAASSEATPAGPLPSTRANQPEPAASPPAAEPAPPPSKPAALAPSLAFSEAEEGLVPVKAPMLGTFYRAPRPGAPPFVDVGTVVAETDTVCIIEVMKVFTTIKAGTTGRIDKVCAENGQMVEFGQALFLIRPEVDR